MDFQIVDKNIKAIQDNDDAGALHIIGVANTGERDLVGDILSDEALNDVCTQALNHNLHLDHDSTLNGILGPITRAELTEQGVEIQADIVNNEYKKKIRELLMNGVKLGMSVSGCTTHSADNPNYLIGWDLTEISLTPLPCDQGTMGTVQIAKSFTDATLRITKNMTEETALEEKKMAEEITIEKVIELINEAFNDRKEEFLETIRGDIRNEYDVTINEIKERIESIESAIASTSTVEVDEATGEVVEDDADVVEENADEDEEEDEEEEEEKSAEKNAEEELEKKIHTLVEKRIDEIFSAKKREDLTFKYDATSTVTGTKQETKKAYTPKELARLLTQGGH